MRFYLNLFILKIIELPEEYREVIQNSDMPAVKKQCLFTCFSITNWDLVTYTKLVSSYLPQLKF